ncbi:MAG TPA: HK97 gp10 family phage protein [Stellaceae bacterium]|nr:HK97 gp10 family phage protein [Stellaceae bacterium]
MITASIAGADGLRALPPALAERLAQEVERLGGVLRERIERKLSGEVLQRRTGRLAGSITVAAERAGTGASITIASDAPYAAIHEYGGSLPGRTVLPASARALAFPWRGQQRFFKRVQLPAVTMPQRSFMRTARDETLPAFRAAVEAAAAEVLQS